MGFIADEQPLVIRGELVGAAHRFPVHLAQQVARPAGHRQARVIFRRLVGHVDMHVAAGQLAHLGGELLNQLPLVAQDQSPAARAEVEPLVYDGTGRHRLAAPGRATDDPPGTSVPATFSKNVSTAARWYGRRV